MKRLVFPLAVSLCFLVLVAQHTPVSAKDNWISVRTKNFLLVGNAGEKDVRQVGLKLEQFREVFTRLFPKLRFNTPVPTTVVVFKSNSSFGPFKPGPNVAGYFQAGNDVNYIALSIEQNAAQNPFETIFHEYTHLLVNNTFDNAPVWFNEGLAEYYSTFEITDDQKVAMGAPIPEHVFLLRDNKMLPLKTLFEVDHRSPHYNESKKQGIFYAQSWALMHYLLIGKAGQVERLGKFVDLLRANVAAEQAFQQSFGMPFEAMEKTLKNYIKQSRYNVMKGHFERKLELDANVQATPLTEAEAQAYLGDLLLHSHRKDAYTYLQKALKLDPNLAMAHASIGMAYFYEGKVDEARASLERAVAANSQNYLAHYYYAFTLSRSPDDSPISGYSPEISAKIREHLQKAIALRPDFPESYNLLGFVSLVTGQQLDEAIAALKQALSASPGRHDFTFTLAQLYVRKRDYKTAVQMLEQVTRANVEDELRRRAEAMLAQMRTVEEQLARFEAAKQARGAGDGPPVLVNVGPTTTDTPARTTTATPEPTPATDPSAYLREVLRAPAAGETQLQGTLLRLECDAKGVVFVVQTAGRLLKLRTAKLDDIEITTYDPGVQGDITCGERKPVNTVVISYVPNGDKRVKADGILKSIEFVPSDFKLKP